MNSTEKSAAVLGLFNYNCDLPNASIFEAFYRQALTVLEDCGIQPTYIAVDGPRFSGSLEPIAGPSHNRMLQTLFSDICDLSIVANPEGSNSPAYDSFAKLSLSYLDTEQELLSTLYVEESFMQFESAAYERFVNGLMQLHSWDFGFGFRAPVISKPDFHILGLDDGTLSPEAHKALCAWYDSSAADRLTLLRDLYSYNIVNEVQLSQRVGNESLRQVAERHGSFAPLARSGLFLWRLSDPELAQVRSQLLASEVLIASRSE